MFRLAADAGLITANHAALKTPPNAEPPPGSPRPRAQRADRRRANQQQRPRPRPAPHPVSPRVLRPPARCPQPPPCDLDPIRATLWLREKGDSVSRAARVAVVPHSHTPVGATMKATPSGTPAVDSCVSPSASRYHATVRSRSETGKPTWWIRDGCIQPPSRSADVGLK